MVTHKNKYLIYLVVLNCLLTILLVIFWTFIFNDVRSMFGITIALVLFFVYEAIVIVFTDNKGENISSRQSINLFLGFKAGKILLSLLFIVIYLVAVKVEFMRFLFAFVVLYLIYLLFDTMYLLTREKSMKKKQYKLKEIEKLSNYY